MAQIKLTRGELKVAKLYQELQKLTEDTFVKAGELVDDETMHAALMIVNEFKRIYDPKIIK